MRLALTILLLAVSLAAQETHEIDRAHAACLEKAHTTVQMTECSGAARDQWDAELNKNYKELLGALKPAAKLSLRFAQKEWMRFRDAEIKNIGAIYGTLQGTVYIPMRAESAMEIVRARAMQLRQYCDALQQKPD
jgi:uncharacterized protein YecT (DUF1311 family)